MTDALLPCPFCGGVQIEAFHHIDRGWGASWHVQCVAEECGNSTCHHDTEANAITAWNKRQPTQIDAEIIAENKRLREALRTVEQGVPRPVGKSWFPDGRPSKHDQCVHGIWMYEPCEGCTDAFIAEALGETK